MTLPPELRALLPSAVGLVLAVAGACDAGFHLEGAGHTTDGDTCPVGSQGCACTAGGACDDGLACVSDSCVELPGGGQCGNGVLEEGEECDLGAQNHSTGECLPNCRRASCGDGFVGPAELCDAGAANAFEGACLPDCTPAQCGDGYLWVGGEACDDGDVLGADGCSATCTLESCGNGVVDAGEQCDDGPLNADDAACTSACALAVCGDGLVAPGEGCDDGVNDGSYGGCLADCSASAGYCGDGMLQPAEACDDGNASANDGCDAGCRLSGTPLWTRTYAGPGGGADRFNAVAPTPTGELVVAGYETVSGQGRAIHVAKFGADGGTIWARNLNWSTSDDVANALAVAPSGAIFVTGQVRTGADRDLWVARLASDGTLAWQQTLDGAGADVNDSGLGVAVDAAETTVHVVGSLDTAASGSDALLASWSTAGVFGASQLRTGSGTSADAFTSVTVLDDAGGDLLVAGTLGITASNLEAYLSRRTSAGATVWEELYAGPTTGVDGARALDRDGDAVVVVGYETVAGQGRNLWLRQYTLSGAFVWTRSLGGTDAAADEAATVTIDPTTGDVVVGGFVASGGAHAIALRYDPAGQLRWSREQSLPLYAGLAFDAVGRLFAAAYVVGDDGWLAELVP